MPQLGDALVELGARLPQRGALIATLLLTTSVSFCPERSFCRFCAQLPVFRLNTSASMFYVQWISAGVFGSLFWESLGVFGENPAGPPWVPGY